MPFLVPLQLPQIGRVPLFSTELSGSILVSVFVCTIFVFSLLLFFVDSWFAGVFFGGFSQSGGFGFREFGYG